MPRAIKQHLVKRADGRYRCKYKGKEFYGWTEPEAFQARQAYIDSLERGEVTPTTVNDYIIPWMNRTFVDVKKTTYNKYATHMQHLSDAIGTKRFMDIVPSDIKQVYADYYTGLSRAYINAAKQLYSSFFDAAMADGLIRFNPARDKAAKPHRGKKPSERVLSPQQREWINTLCQDHRAFPAVMTMLYAGVRPQEMKAIDIDRDVDFENNTITVRETAHIDPDNKQRYIFNDELKTDWSARTIPLFKPLKDALEGKHGPLIATVHGEKVTKQAWRVVWKSYINHMETAINGCQKRWYGRMNKHKDQELPPWIEFDIVPYTLRHAFCTFCRDSGVEMNTCRKWMGHADAKMVLKVYDSVSDDRSEAERKKVERMLNKGSERGSDNEQKLQEAMQIKRYT